MNSRSFPSHPHSNRLRLRLSSPPFHRLSIYLPTHPIASIHDHDHDHDPPFRPSPITSSHGFVIGHVVPEAQVGGPIALVQDGDIINIDAVKNTLDMDVPAEELERRRKAWKAPPLKVNQGTLYKYTKLVTDASHGCITDA